MEHLLSKNLSDDDFGYFTELLNIRHTIKKEFNYSISLSLASKIYDANQEFPEKRIIVLVDDLKKPQKDE